MRPVATLGGKRREFLDCQSEHDEIAENAVAVRHTAEAALVSKAEALAEAKHWLRNLSAEDVSKFTIDLPKGLPEGTRGSRRELSNTPEKETPRPFKHPYFWSSFVLIGDAS